MIEGLRDCFNENFTKWLLKSNNPKVGPYLGEDRHKHMLVQVERESLQEILDILIREPLADYFWYTYRKTISKPIINYGPSRLTYSLPHHDTVPGGAIRVDKEKIKVFLRDIKIEMVLQ
jgi:hypothetical protein